MRRRSSRPVLVVLIGLALLPSAARAQAATERFDGPKLPEHVAANRDAPVVTAANLLASERFWPYRVALVEPWAPVPQANPIPTELDGVLIRVETPEIARVDFGRNGVQRVPIDKTDLVTRANRVRLGADEKMMPNLAYQIAPRLGDAASDVPRAYPLLEAMEKRGFLCVFADPGDPGFPALAKALGPLAGHPGVLTVLFPQGEHPDLAVRDLLRKLGWKSAFVLDYLSEAYTATLVDPGAAMPVVQLQTSEGRIVLEGPWKKGFETQLAAALAASFPPEAQASASSAAPRATP